MFKKIKQFFKERKKEKDLDMPMMKKCQMRKEFG